MNHLPDIIRDLGVILMTASVVCLIFAQLKLPLVLGYLLSGFLLSPTITIFPNLLDSKTVETWAEIGIIFMMFNLGIEFSFRRLTQIGARVLTIGLFQVAFMFLVGFKIGKYFGLPTITSFFIGSMFCISSTAVIIKAFEEYQLKAKQFAQTALGILVFQDLFAMLLLVFLTTLGRTQEVQGFEIILTSGKLLFYLIIWLTFGLFAIPSIIKYSEKFLTDEIALVVSIGLCFGMVALSVQSGFSPALGAFVMGSILAETAQRERFERLLHPLKDLFSAIFFVSIGLMVNPQIFLLEPQFILVATAAIILGNILSVTSGGLLSGLSLKNSIFAGLSLTQIGEFSFIIAGLGIGFKLLEPKHLSIIVAVAVLTTLTTPFLILKRERIFEFINSRIPQTLKNSLEQYERVSDSVGGNRKWQRILQDFLVRVLINALVAVTLFILVSKYIAPKIRLSFSNGYLSEVVILFIALLFAAPFFWGMVFSKSEDQEFKNLYRSVINRRGRKFLFYLRSALAITLCFFLISFGLSVRVSAFVFLGIAITYSFFLRRFMGAIYVWFEKGFQMPAESDVKNHSEHDPEALAHQLVPWQQQLQEVPIPHHCQFVGQTLAELKIRERFGVVIAMIRRGQDTIATPSKDERIFPFDRIYVVGDDMALDGFLKAVNEKSPSAPTALSVKDVRLLKYVVNEGSSLIGKTIRSSGIREKTQALVVGIERGEQRILSPDSQFEILPGDQLWLVGERNKIQELN